MVCGSALGTYGTLEGLHRPVPSIVVDEALLALSFRVHLDGRDVPEEKLCKFEECAAEIITAFGLDLETPGTRDTPRRLIRALFDSTEGYDGDPKLVRVFPTETNRDDH